MNARVIQLRPSRNPRWQKQGGWDVFEAEGVCPVYCGESGHEPALSYAQQRAGYGRYDISCSTKIGALSRRSQMRIKAGCVAADDYMTFATRGCSLSVRVCPKADLARDPAWYVAI